MGWIAHLVHVMNRCIPCVLRNVSVIHAYLGVRWWTAGIVLIMWDFQQYVLGKCKTLICLWTLSFWLTLGNNLDYVRILLITYQPRKSYPVHHISQFDMFVLERFSIINKSSVISCINKHYELEATNTQCSNKPV
jgi:hypothetical protein